MTQASILYKTRRVLNDMGEAFASNIAGDGVTSIFELPATLVDSVTVGMGPAGSNSFVMLNFGTDYTLDAYNGIVALKVPPAQGQVLAVLGNSYEYWPDTDMLDYVGQAFGMHTLNRNPPAWSDPVPGAVPPTNVLPFLEERCVALLAAKLVIQDAATQAAKDITIDTGDGTVVPRSQRYAQLAQEANRIDEEYRELTEHLGVQGYDTVQVLDLRRVSRTTNRLVPLYVPREWDDRRFAHRVLPPVDLPIGIQGQVIIYRGDWLPMQTYVYNDIVSDRGRRYLCTSAVVGIDPLTDVAAGDGVNGLHWSITYIDSGLAGYYGGY